MDDDARTELLWVSAILLAGRAGGGLKVLDKDLADAVDTARRLVREVDKGTDPVPVPAGGVSLTELEDAA